MHIDWKKGRKSEIKPHNNKDYNKAAIAIIIMKKFTAKYVQQHKLPKHSANQRISCRCGDRNMQQ